MTKAAGTMAVVAAVALTACGSGGGAGTSGVSLSVKAAATTATSTPAGLEVGQGVTLSRIRLAVRRIAVEGGDATTACEPALVTTTATPLTALKGPPGGTGPSMDPALAASLDAGEPDHGPQLDVDDGECELAFGPFDVDLAGSALSGGVDYAFSAPIPAGTYERVSVSVNTVSAERAGANPVLQQLAAAHASILVDGFVEDVGTTTARPFAFSAPVQVKQTREGRIVLGPSSNVTLTFDPSGWFVGPGGVRLDPTDPTAQGAILDNVRASIRLIHDDDHDGIDDDAEHGHR